MKEMYLPPLPFESSYLPRVRRRPMKQRFKTRIMLPMSTRCNTCGNHICRGTKFNSRKEEVVGETYLGNRRFRFYFTCTHCSAVLAIKTQPQHPDRVVESGATMVMENGQRKREAEEMGDFMNSKREIDILPALDEINSMKKSKDFVRRVEDEDSEDAEDLTRPCVSNDESLNSALKNAVEKIF